MKKIYLYLVCLLLILGSVYAIPQTFNIHGKLTDSSGSVLSDSHNMTFKIWDHVTGGSELWSSSNISVTTDSGGVYNVILDEIDLNFSDVYYLGVTVNADSEMSPRVNLTSTPYTFRANDSDYLGGQPEANLNVNSSLVSYDLENYNTTTMEKDTDGYLTVLKSWLTGLFIELTDTFGGDVSGTYDATVVNQDFNQTTDLEVVNSSFIDQNSSDHVSFVTDNLSGNSTYTDIYGWPPASPQYSAITALDDSPTATEGWDLLRPSHIFAHSDEETALAVADIWYNLTFDVHEDEIKENITHTYNDATNDTFTIGTAGYYDIDWGFGFLDSAAPLKNHIGTRIIKNENIEINGSVEEKDTTTQNAIGNIDGFATAYFKVGDKIKLQAVSNATSISVVSEKTFGTHPTSRKIRIKRIT